MVLLSLRPQGCYLEMLSVLGDVTLIGFSGRKMALHAKAEVYQTENDRSAHKSYYLSLRRSK